MGSCTLVRSSSCRDPFNPAKIADENESSKILPICTSPIPIVLV